MTPLAELSSAIQRRVGERDRLQADLARVEDKLLAAGKRARALEKAQAAVQEVAQRTQAELEFHVSELVTLALAAVFPDPYKFGVAFEQRRGRTEADLYLERGGERIHPLSAAGGGVVDVAAFALRASMWSLRRGRSAPLLILDEPFRFLSEGLRPKAAALLKEVSERLGVQILMVTHAPELAAGADAVFTVSQRNGKTKVRKES